MTLERMAAFGASLVMLASLVMAFLSIKPDHLDDRLAFAAILGALLAICILLLGRTK